MPKNTRVTIFDGYSPRDGRTSTVSSDRGKQVSSGSAAPQRPTKLPKTTSSVSNAKKG